MDLTGKPVTEGIAGGGYDCRRLSGPILDTRMKVNFENIILGSVVVTMGGTISCIIVFD